MSDWSSFPPLTAEQLRKLLKYDPETGLFYWLEIRGRKQTDRPAGSVGPTGYCLIRVDNTDHYAHRLAWLYTTGEWPSHHIDHVNRDKADNRFANLREATRSQNLGNSGRSKANKSGFKGVSFYNDRNRWVAEIMVDRKRKRLGYFKTKEQAARAYQYEAERQRGEFV